MAQDITDRLRFDGRLEVRLPVPRVDDLNDVARLGLIRCGL